MAASRPPSSSCSSRYVGDYGATYGTLAGIVVFLLWLWILNLALLAGAELNEQLEDERERRRGVAAVSARRATGRAERHPAA